jgi:succinate dehydrogenase/fumarate reductase flavoprotein subunit
MEGYKTKYLEDQCIEEESELRKSSIIQKSDKLSTRQIESEIYAIHLELEEAIDETIENQRNSASFT